MGEPILKASDVPTKLPPNKDQSAVKAKFEVDGSVWNVTCVSMGNPHCVTFGTESSQVLSLETVLLFRGRVCLFNSYLAMFQGLNVDELNLAEIGPKFEHHTMFPARTNTGNWFYLVELIVLCQITNVLLLNASSNK